MEKPNKDGIKEVYSLIHSPGATNGLKSEDAKTFQHSVSVSLEPTQETIDFYHQMYSVNMQGLSKHSLVREMKRNVYSLKYPPIK